MKVQWGTASIDHSRFSIESPPVWFAKKTYKEEEIRFWEEMALGQEN